MRVSIAVCVTAVLVSIASAQRTLKVPSQYASITTAIAAAKSGDTVLVAPGTYQETVDFVGKAIRVAGEKGFAVTTIRAPRAAAAVRFQTGEGRDSILEHFTVTGGADSGIKCVNSSPTVRLCDIVSNRAPVVDFGVFFAKWVAQGGGIYCKGSNALIEDCQIRSNQAVATYVWDTDTVETYGGGVYATGSNLEIRRCLILNNWCSATAMLHTMEGPSLGGGLCLGGASLITNSLIRGNSVFRYQADGGGVFTGSSSRLLHCNVVGNRANAYGSTGHGVAGGTYVNCIIRDNYPTQQQFKGVATYCNVTGGWTGTGNFDADPKYADGNYHLRADSPCRNRGSATVTGLPATDHEGDPRIGDGQPDVGMDEVYAGFIWWGDARPGGNITLQFTGAPGAEVYWAFSLRKLGSPSAIAGLEGWFGLDPTSFGLVRFANLPAGGRLAIPYAIAVGFPRLAVHMQALIGKQMTRLTTVTIR